MSIFLKHAPTILVFGGAIISACGVLWAALRQAEMEQQVQMKTEQLAAQGREIAQLNNEIRGIVTGGDSFCFVRLQHAMAEDPMVIIVHKGKFPLYDVSIRLWQIETLPDLKKHENLKLEKLMANSRLFSVGNMVPGHVAMVGRIKILGAKAANFGVQIASRNGGFVQQLKMRKEKDSWKLAIRVQAYQESGPMKDVFTEIDPGYPIDKTGKVNW